MLKETEKEKEREEEGKGKEEKFIRILLGTTKYQRKHFYNEENSIKIVFPGTFLAVQWLDSMCPVQASQVPSLLRGTKNPLLWGQKNKIIL